MRNTRPRDTAPELALRRALHARGLRYRVNFKPAPSVRSTADIVFTKAKVAVYVDGCFWHSCPQHGNLPKANREWWRKKLENTVARDLRIERELSASGWVVLRVWEHECPADAAKMVHERVRKPAPPRGRRSSATHRAESRGHDHGASRV